VSQSVVEDLHQKGEYAAAAPLLVSLYVADKGVRSIVIFRKFCSLHGLSSPLLLLLLLLLTLHCLSSSSSSFHYVGLSSRHSLLLLLLRLLLLFFSLFRIFLHSFSSCFHSVLGVSSPCSLYIVFDSLSFSFFHCLSLCVVFLHLTLFFFFFFFFSFSFFFFSLRVVFLHLS
jgi:hypothetical protein